MVLASTITRYGIQLRPMGLGDLEQVRLWRNAPHVRSRMAYQEAITPEMQAAWWEGLDPQTQHYYIIRYKGKEIGVIHAKDIDWQRRTAETGIFVGEEEWLGTFVPVLAVLALMDELFGKLGMQQLRAKVMAEAQQTVAYNEKLGYKVVELVDGFLLMEVDGEGYQRATQVLRSMAARMAG